VSPKEILVSALWKFPKNNFYFTGNFLYMFVFNDVSLASAVSHHAQYIFEPFKAYWLRDAPPV
jgi:hypothetical protein